MGRLKILTLVLGLTLLGLLGIRQYKYGGWQYMALVNPAAQEDALTARDTWMHILQNGRKIGYAHSSRKITPQGYTIGEEVVMRLTALGTVQEIRMTTQAGLTADLSLADFKFSLNSGPFLFESQGQVDGRRLLVEMQTSEGDRAITIPLTTPPHLPAALLDVAHAAGLAPGAKITFPLFDPATLGNAPATIANTGPETIEVSGIMRPAHHYEIQFKGAVQHAWMDDEGNIWRQEGLLGLVLEQTTRQAALTALVEAGGGDIIQDVSIRADKELVEPDLLDSLTVAITGIDDRLASLGGGRQHLNGRELTIVKETIPAAADRQRAFRSGNTRAEYLKTTPFIQTDHPRIKALVAEITGKHDSAVAKVRKCMAWMAANIQHRPVLSLPSALAVLEHQVGDCNEHAVLLAALCRAAGIPAQVEAGLVYQKGRYYYHAWNRLYLGEWITADAIFQQLPADVTHIRLARGAQNLHFDLMGIIGKIGLQIIAAPGVFR